MIFVTNKFGIFLEPAVFLPNLRRYRPGVIPMLAAQTAAV